MIVCMNKIITPCKNYFQKNILRFDHWNWTIRIVWILSLSGSNLSLKVSELILSKKLKPQQS